MKKFLKILAGIGAVVVIALTAVMFMTAGMTDAADEFFTAVKSNNYDMAYTHLSEDFKNNTSKNELKTYLTKNSFSNFKETSWESRSINGGRGELIGSITTDNGGVIPVSLSFIKGESDWKIYAIKKPSSGIQEETQASVQLPTEKEQVKLVSDSMHIFAVSVKDKNMSSMFDHVSNLWQKQFSVQKFDDTFKSFYQFGDKLLVLDKMTPQFSEKASISDDGVLILKGRFATKPEQINFEQKYIYEGLSWKLFGFSVNIVRV